MTTHICADLSDRDLLDATTRAAGAERGATVELLRLLAEVDARRLHLGEGCSSLFTYCTQILHLSEHAAYHRIEAARAGREFPYLLEMLTDGALTLTTITLLGPHLTRDNYRTLIDAARHQTKREVEHLVAALAPKPATPATIRKLPVPKAVPVAVIPQPPQLLLSPTETKGDATPAVPVVEVRYQLRVTLTADTQATLRRAQDLMRHSNPTGDPAVIVERALTLLVEHLEKTKIARTSRPRATREASPTTRRRSRHVPAAVKRAVWARDKGRCAFEGAHGQCTETGLLEFHHLVPFADGGPTTAANLALRCRAHNAFEAERLLLAVRELSASPLR